MNECHSYNSLLRLSLPTSDAALHVTGESNVEVGTVAVMMMVMMMMMMMMTLKFNTGMAILKCLRSHQYSPQIHNLKIVRYCYSVCRRQKRKCDSIGNDFLHLEWAKLFKCARNQL